MDAAQTALLLAALVLLLLAGAGVEGGRYCRLGWLGVACAVRAAALPTFTAM